MKKSKLSIQPLEHLLSFLSNNYILFDKIETLPNEEKYLKVNCYNIVVSNRIKLKRKKGTINYFSQEETKIIKTAKENYQIIVEPFDERKKLKFFFPKSYNNQKLAIVKRYKSARTRTIKELKLEKKCSVTKCLEENNKTIQLLKIEYKKLVQKIINNKIFDHLDEQIEVFNIIYREYILWFHKNDITRQIKSGQFLLPWRSSKKEFIMFIVDKYNNDLSKHSNEREYSSFADCMRVNHSSYVFENNWKYKSTRELYKKLRKDGVV